MVNQGKVPVPQPPKDSPAKSGPTSNSSHSTQEEQGKVKDQPEYAHTSKENGCQNKSEGVERKEIDSMFTSF